jgi:hypothetical protein
MLGDELSEVEMDAWDEKRAFMGSGSQRCSVDCRKAVSRFILPGVVDPAAVQGVGALSRKETTVDAASNSGGTCSGKLQGATFSMVYWSIGTVGASGC